MKRKITITYNWWTDDPFANGLGVLPEVHQELENESESHIFEMLRDGFTSGNLLHTDSENLIEFVGWWSADFENLEDDED